MTDRILPFPGDGLEKPRPAYDADHVRSAIKAVLARRGVKPRPLAEASGLAEGALRKYLAGGTDSMTLESVCKLAAALRISVSELIDDPRAPRPASTAGAGGGSAASPMRAIEAQSKLLDARCKLLELLEQGAAADEALAELAAILAPPRPPHAA